MQDCVIRVSELNKTFGAKQVLFDLSLDIARGEMVALIGSSGSGKSTLLRHLSGLTRADHPKQDESGHIHVMGDVIQQHGRLSRNVRRHRSKIGYVFQQFNLVGRLSVMENVLLGHLGRIPRWRGACRLFSESEKKAAMTSLTRVGMAEFCDRRASTLSGGQQQRVAIARALTQRAEVILADEPIASLDPESAKNVMDILADINATDKTTVLVSLHQIDYAREYCPRTVALKKGRIHYNGATHSLCDSRLAQIYGAEVAEIVTPLHGDPATFVRQMAMA
ncbi:phosphonates import ATP-binding protein PhnC 2 [Betaproteobacteria bacterium]|nr:phosphonates import ATP-binding protein PhnC 2 [Betaproteobacteria bacterium]GHU10367.1 phosphonates import ATP-binding protein PhnC 2 [Betaproteobacteria bacterium]GHU14967.1 phosphonates import ATP-binding protein PhnC 2 [Betaproteobacteria bacterium]GHU16320.1 phosphonates import ATP-binding protein PhnC 2 [Betaproteobacteria bacterium]GHU46061.1 phosphonates import ATP-binding protein PhnC 2 [Betaproteobacteria bacterium]